MAPRHSTRALALLSLAIASISLALGFVTLDRLETSPVRTSVRRELPELIKRTRVDGAIPSSTKAGIKISSYTDNFDSEDDVATSSDYSDELLIPEMVKHIQSCQHKLSHGTTNHKGHTNLESGGDPNDNIVGPNYADSLSPVQVHMVWIGDISKAPNEHTRYRDRGYNLTVHSDPEEILDGFHPFVLKAYRLALPLVVGYDFLKFALLYKYGGLSVDADTYPRVHASEVQREFPHDDCDVVFGKEDKVKDWKKPAFRESGGRPRYKLNRPFQILNWAMAASKPRSAHIRQLMQSAMMHFFGLRDMEQSLVQDISGSGLMTDYVALLHEKHGRSYRDVFEDNTAVFPVERLCLVETEFFKGRWVDHSFLGSWKPSDALWYAIAISTIVGCALAVAGSVWCVSRCWHRNSPIQPASPLKAYSVLPVAKRMEELSTTTSCSALHLSSPATEEVILSGVDVQQEQCA